MILFLPWKRNSGTNSVDSKLGWSSMYDGSSLVSHGVNINEPFIFVAVNYRVNGFGFMPGKEVLEDGASNLGLLDQRMGLEWVADNIAAFGGDPDKVTIWGESAGALSVADQMVLYGGDNKYKGEHNPIDICPAVKEETADLFSLPGARQTLVSRGYHELWKRSAGRSDGLPQGSGGIRPSCQTCRMCRRSRHAQLSPRASL